MTLRCIDHLIQEHRLILRAVYVLDAMADKAKDGMPPVEDVEMLLGFFRRFVDDHHQHKEEAFLFPVLRNTELGKSNTPLTRMAFEHEQERSIVEGLENALRTRNSSDFSYFGHRMAAVLSSHIYKEDNILFALANNAISAEDDARVLDQMTKLNETLRPEVYTELAQTVTQLEWKYLGRAA